MRPIILIAVTLSWLLPASSAFAAFHLIQIEEIIGGINGDTTEQAIQLRYQFGDQNAIANFRVRYWNSTGTVATTLFTFPSAISSTPSKPTGTNILLASTAFNSLMSSVPGYSSDFTLTSTIPANILAGGKLTFETDTGSIIWSVAFGAYTGTNTGVYNDTDFGGATVAIPTDSMKGIHFTAAAGTASTTNAAQYSVIDPAKVRGLAGGAGVTVVPEPGAAGMLIAGALGLGGLIFARRRA